EYERNALDEHPKKGEHDEQLSFAVLAGDEDQNEPKSGPSVGQELAGVDHEPLLPRVEGPADPLSEFDHLIPVGGLFGELTERRGPQTWLCTPDDPVEPGRRRARLRGRLRAARGHSWHLPAAWGRGQCGCAGSGEARRARAGGGGRGGRGRRARRRRFGRRTSAPGPPWRRERGRDRRR